MPPILSVVCPTFNRAALLNSAVQSVFEDDLLDAEVLIADDGSTDNTSEIYSMLRDRYGATKVKLTRSEENQGAQVARNRGMSAAKGKYLMFLDSDDILHPNGIFTLIDRLQKSPGLDFAYGKVIITDENLVPLSDRSPIGNEYSSLPNYLTTYDWHTMGPVYRTEFLQTIGPWNEDLTGSQDWEYQARVKLAGGRGEFLNLTSGYWRQHTQERVGTEKFRFDYTRSVVMACESILRKAELVGLDEPNMRRHLARKLIVHAFEFGANGHRIERKQCLNQATDCAKSDLTLRYSCKFAEHLPPLFDRWIWNYAMKKGK